MPDSEWPWMQRALELAERGRGFVEPNPLVGAVVVRDGNNVGEGWHERFGQAHAEVNALAMAGDNARGATLYVTLEPCCHQGKTPPCTDAVIRAGINRVVAAMDDPFPQVAGKGAELLNAAGVAVDIGLGAAEARKLNVPYLKLLKTGWPYIHAKWAMTLDGKIATRTGDSKWISNEASRRPVHELRRRMDGIIVGIGTALADDPLLTARPPGPRVATRIVLDSRGRLPLGSQLVRTARDIPTLVVTAAKPSLRNAGCELVALPSADERVDIAALLDSVGRRRMTNVLVEGGSTILGAFHDAGAIDECDVFISPRLAGGADAASPMAGTGVARIAECLRLQDVQVDLLEGDIRIRGRFSR